MGKHAQVIDTRPAQSYAAPSQLAQPQLGQAHAGQARTAQRRRIRSRVKPAHFIFGFTAACAFVLVTVVDPYSGATASPYFQLSSATTDVGPAQAVLVAAEYSNTIIRDGYAVTDKPKPIPVPIVAAVEKKTSAFAAPAAAVPDPGSAKAYAFDAVGARGWGEEQYSCLVSLWQKESGWRVNAQNSSSGAYGIPQSLPGSKMATAGGDWATNAGTQIEWGLGYITGRYGTPCGAWQKSQASGWY